jgi:RNA polymerase sigma-70 factor (ECF subfamily)
MSEPIPFEQLIRRVRAGDQAAAAELVRTYEPAIRRAVRYRLADAHLGNVLDSMDICQSVLGSFFVRAASGQYELEQPEQLLKLLVTMARNKLVAQGRRQFAQRRDQRRVELAGDGERNIAAAQATPSRALAARELLDEVHRRLSPDERQLVDWRNEGLEWTDIALRAATTPEAARKKLARALDRIAVQLGLEEDGNE